MGKRRRRSRANGEGWINKRADGRWDVGITVHTAEGLKRIRTTKRRRENADRWLTEQKAKRGMGLAFDAAKLTFAEYLERWLELGVKGSVKAGTYLSHRSNVRQHLAPALGGIRLGKLTAAHLQSLYHAKVAEGLSPRTVLGIHGTARKALGQAVKWDLVPRNAASNASPPRPEQAKVMPLSREEAKALMKAAEGHRLKAMYALALATGARHGELLALSWADISYTNDGAEIAIRHTYARALPKREGGQSFEVGTPKTGRARVVAVGQRTAEALRSHSRLLKEERLEHGPGYREGGLVFPQASGKPLSPRTSAREFRRVCRQAGLSAEVHFHTLRHTFATMHLLDNTPVKVVSEALGHSSIKQTMDTYSHVLPNMQKEAAARLDSVLF